jgi:hypothetical protein
LGIATTRYEDRTLSALKDVGHAQVKFESWEGLCGGGVLFMLPALLTQGLLRTKEVYQLPSNHYYGLESVVLTLAFMALSRIKNPEQLKQCKPGEIGRIIGLDRVPEVRCLRDKIKLLSGQKKAEALNNLLIDQWYSDERKQDSAFLYIDGHQRIYYGHQANIPTKYISRQKLCLSATTEFWVNDVKGMPVMMVVGELSERLEEAIDSYIIPQMYKTSLLQHERQSDQTPQCTFVFDREAYHPSFFAKLWNEHRIAVITYRKNVKDLWAENRFKPYEISVLNKNVNMLLCEDKVVLDGHSFCEVRKLSDGGHQTAIISTHPSISVTEIAGKMFARWVQENFFRYLIADYDFDKMIEFGTQSIDAEKQIVNPEYRKVCHQLKKHKEKISRLQAKLYPLAEQVMDENIENVPETTHKQGEYKEQIDQLLQEQEAIVAKRNSLQARIKLKEMPDSQRYNKLKTESKLLMNVIKMICYRSESAVLSLIAPHLNRSVDEGRMLVKQIIQNHADILPDYKNGILNVTLHSLSAPRFNHAAQQLTTLLNETETIFPGTNLKMVFKITAAPFCDR